MQGQINGALKVLFPVLTIYIAASSFCFIQKSSSMTVIISAKNQYFYYENKLKEDGSNFKIGWYKDTKQWAELLEQKNGKENIDYILKVEKKDSLNEVSKKLIDFFKSKSHYKISSITKSETELVRLTERLNF